MGCGKGAAEIHDTAENRPDLLELVESEFYARPRDHIQQHPVDSGRGKIQPEGFLNDQFLKTMYEVGRKMFSFQPGDFSANCFHLTQYAGISFDKAVDIVGKMDRVPRKPDIPIRFLPRFFFTPGMVVDSNEFRCFSEKVESAKEVGPQFRVISMLLELDFHRCDLLLYGENTDIVQHRCVHQVGLRNGIESHCVPKSQCNVCNSLLMSNGTGVNQVQGVG